MNTSGVTSVGAGVTDRVGLRLYVTCFTGCARHRTEPSPTRQVYISVSPPGGAVGCITSPSNIRCVSFYAPKQNNPHFYFKNVSLISLIQLFESNCDVGHDVDVCYSIKVPPGVAVTSFLTALTTLINRQNQCVHQGHQLFSLT